VLAFSPSLAGVDATVRDGDSVRMGDQRFEVIHTPGHSSDSICLYNEAEGVLFAGDTPLVITSPVGSYETGFQAALEKLCSRDVRRIYFGHGPPLTEGCNERLRESLRLARSNGPVNRALNPMTSQTPVAAKYGQRENEEKGNGNAK
jgi:glyoxylase-like metal-dependent hydrolase (beta-lactamase superfamily II)